MRPLRPPGQSVERSTHAKQTDQSVEKTSVRGACDSEEPTEFGLVRGSWIVKETEELGDKTTKDHIETDSGTDAVIPIQSSKSTTASPNVSEFENYLEGLHSKEDSRAASSSMDTIAMSLSLHATKPAHLTKDEWWVFVLRAEQERVKNWNSLI